MIRHFLKRDFKDYRLYWFMVALLVSVFLILFWATGMIFYLYLAAYSGCFLAFLPVNYLTGVTWRAQHIMSRNYLLALPVARKKMFNMILIRMLVFWTPLWGLLFYLPFEMNRTIPYTLHFYGEYILLILAGSFWLVNVTIGMQLRFETITRYMHQKQRIRAWVRMLAGALLESGVMVAALLCLYGSRLLYVWITLILCLAVALREYRANLRKWV